MKALSLLCLCIALAGISPATAEAQASAEDQLRQGLFEEEANRNLDRAENHYQALVEAHQRDRAIAATALFRLGEIARKREQKQSAIDRYRMLIRQFPEAADLVRLAHQNLKGMGASANPPNSNPFGSSESPDPSAPADPFGGPNPFGGPAPAVDAEATALARLKRIVAESPDLVDGPDTKGWRPLHHAATKGWSNVIAYLMERKVDVDATTVTEGLTATQLATIHGHLATLRRLLDAGARHDSIVNIPLQVPGMQDFLPARPAPLGLAQGSWSLLDLAITYDRRAIIEHLLSLDREQVKWLTSRAGPQVPNPKLGLASPKELELTAVQLALWLNRDTLATYLAENGASLDAPSDQGVSTLYLATCLEPQFALWLLEKDADPEIGHPAKGITPLHQAIFSNQAELATALITAGAPVNAHMTDGSAPLHFAANPETVTLLLDHAADINPANHDKLTPLARLGIAGSDENARAAFLLLLEKGATCADPQRVAKAARYLLPDVLEGLIYPAAFNPDEIRVTDQASRSSLNIVATMPQAGVPPPPLADIIAMHHLKHFRSSQARSRHNPPLGSLRVIRAGENDGIDIAFATRGAKLGSAELPELKWGDIVELNVLSGKEAPAGSPTFDTFLTRTVAPRKVAIQVGPVQEVIALPMASESSAAASAWQTINLRHLLQQLGSRQIQSAPITIRRSDIDEPLDFKMSHDWEFRLVHHDRIEVPISTFKPDHNVLIMKQNNPLQISAMGRYDGSLLDLLGGLNHRSHNPCDWNKVMIHHLNDAPGQQRPSRSLDIEAMLSALPQERTSHEAYAAALNKIDYRVKPGTLIVLSKVPADNKSAVKRAGEIDKKLSQIHQARQDMKRNRVKGVDAELKPL